MGLGQPHRLGDAGIPSGLIPPAGPQRNLREPRRPLRDAESASIELRRDAGRLRLELEQHILHGGYPGTAPLVQETGRLADYIVEPTTSRDILSLTDVRRPALLRGFFELSCSHCA